MLFKKPLIFLYFLTFISFSFISFATVAQGEVWADPNYDFKSVKKIMIFPALINENVNEPLAPEKATEFFTNSLKKEKVFFLTVESVLERIIFVTGKNPLENKEVSKEEAFFDFIRQASEYVDCILILHVLDCGYSQGMIGGFNLPIQSFQTAFVHGTGGYAGSIQYPYTQYISIPAHMAKYSNATCVLYLSDPKKNALVWAYSDQESQRYRLTNKVSPLGVLKKLVEKGISELPF